MSSDLKGAELTLDVAYSKLVDDDGSGRWRCGICELGWHEEMDDIKHGPDCFADRILAARDAVAASRQREERLRETLEGAGEEIRRHGWVSANSQQEILTALEEGQDGE